MPKRSTRSKKKNKLYSSDTNSNNGSLDCSVNSEISNTSEEDSNNDLQELKNELNSQLNELVFYKIEMPSSSSNKKIISCVEKILEIYNKIYNDNYKNKEKNEDNNMPLDENLKKTFSDLSELERKENSLTEKNSVKKSCVKNFNTFEVNNKFNIFILL